MRLAWLLSPERRAWARAAVVTVAAFILWRWLGPVILARVGLAPSAALLEMILYSSVDRLP